MGLSGGMVWSLEFDDFKGKCGGGNYPLLTKIYDMLNGNLKDWYERPPPINCPPPTRPPTRPPTTTPTPTTTTPTPTTTTPTPTTTIPTPTTTTPTPTTTPSTTTTPHSTTQLPEGTTIIDGHLFICPKQGYFSHPTNRHKFVECVYLNSHWKIYVMDCLNDTVWDEKILTCVEDTGNTNPPTTHRTAPPTRTTPTRGSSTKASTFVCTKAGSFRDPKDCRKHHKCVLNDLKLLEDIVSFCDKGMAFDEVTSTCRPKKEVPGCENDLY